MIKNNLHLLSYSVYNFHICPGMILFSYIEAINLSPLNEAKKQEKRTNTTSTGHCSLTREKSTGTFVDSFTAKAVQRTVQWTVREQCRGRTSCPREQTGELLRGGGEIAVRVLWMEPEGLCRTYFLSGRHLSNHYFGIYRTETNWVYRCD